MPSPLRNFVLAVVLTQLSGCGFLLVHGMKEVIAAAQKNRKAEIDSELVRFSEHLERAEYEQTSRMFTLDGEVSLEARGPAVGRAAISALFASEFTSMPAAYAMHASGTSDEGEQVKQHGTYSRTTIAPSGRPVVLRGTFSAVWVHEPDGRWYMRRLRTSAAPATNEA